MTDGMKLGIDDCEKKDKLYEVRNLPDDLWERFVTICIVKGYNKPRRILHGGGSE